MRSRRLVDEGKLRWGSSEWKPFFLVEPEGIGLTSREGIAMFSPLSGFESDRVVGYPSGQRGQTVNLLALPSQVRILFLPPFFQAAKSGISCTFLSVFLVFLESV